MIDTKKSAKEAFLVFLVRKLDQGRTLSCYKLCEHKCPHGFKGLRPLDDFACSVSLSL